MTSSPSLRARLARLDSADPDRRLFASFHHGYRLEPPLEAADLRAVEKPPWFNFELADPLHQYPVLRFGDNPRYR